MKKRKKLIPRLSPPVDYYNPNEKRRGVIEGMTDQNRIMIEFFFGDARFNKYRAYRMAGYKGEDASGQVSAIQLFNKAAVRKEVKRRKMVLMKRQGLSAELLFEELSEIVMSDMRDFFDEDGLLKPLRDWTPEQGRMIAQLETIEGDDGVGVIRKIKRDQRLKAIELLLKVKGLLDKEERDDDIRGGLFVKIVLDRD